VEYEKTIMSGMQWLGLDWDEGPDRGGDFGPYRQSERLEMYRTHAELLLSEGCAYRDGEAVIFRVPQGKTISFDDAVYGNITMQSETYKDIVLLKSDGFPTYNFAAVVDDYTMDITWVIRGEDHIMNTPKQILLYDAFGWRLPRFAHLPMILGTDKKKLSKRHGATSVYEYRDLGFLPDGVFNFLALLGWNPGDEREVFDRKEAVSLFELSRVTKKAAVFDMNKCHHINQEHLKRCSPETLFELVSPFWKELGLPVESHSRAFLEKALVLMGGRGQTTRELAEYSDYFLSFAPVISRYTASDLDPGKRALLDDFFRKLLVLDVWNVSSMEEMTRRWVEANGVKMKDVAMAFRWILTGRKVSPGIFEVAELLGRDEVAKRLAHYGFPGA
jgi:glutamyl-tRNA synthetase